MSVGEGCRRGDLARFEAPRLPNSLYSSPRAHATPLPWPADSKTDSKRVGVPWSTPKIPDRSGPLAAWFGANRSQCLTPDLLVRFRLHTPLVRVPPFDIVATE